MSYLLWQNRTEPGHCVLGATYIEDVDKLHFGEQVPHDFGQPIRYRMSDLFPDDIALSDNYFVSGQIIVSRKLMEVLKALLPDDPIQYLPATILNHKKRVASNDYFIVHPHRVVDCIDLKKSRVEWNPLDPECIVRCAGLVIDNTKIPTGVQLLRPKFWGSEILIAKPLAQQLTQHGFTGLDFVEPTSYTGIS